MKAHRGDPHGHAEEMAARRRGGHAHQHMLKSGGAHRHERKRGGGVPGEEKIEEAEEKELGHRKRGGKVHGSKPKANLGRAGRHHGEHHGKEHERKRGGRMTPADPLSGAGGAEPPFPAPKIMPVDEHGKGGPMERKHGGRAHHGGHKKRARGGGVGMGKKDHEDRSGGGRLTTGERNRLPRADFALPGKGAGPHGKGAGSYPIEDESHARNALARVSQHGTAEEKATVRRRVHAKFPGIQIS